MPVIWFLGLFFLALHQMQGALAMKAVSTLDAVALVSALVRPRVADVIWHGEICYVPKSDSIWNALYNGCVCVFLALASLQNDMIPGNRWRKQKQFGLSMTLIISL